jgi:hypothetical protein
VADSLDEAKAAFRYTLYETDLPGKFGYEPGICEIEYFAEYTVNHRAQSNIGPHETHALLHMYHETLGAIPDQHILFGPTQTEAFKRIGDIEAYREAVTGLKERLLAFESNFVKLAGRPGLDRCVLAEIQEGERLYLDEPQSLPAFYRKLVRSSNPDRADREARFNRMYDFVSEGKSKQFLLAHGCAPF